jgi:3-oxoacyl-[acyl-carrier protein] reductase
MIEERVMDLGFEGKVALVTGATGGIGGAAARCLAAEGARIGVAYHGGRAAADRLVAEIEGAGGAAIAVHHDLEDPATAPAAVARLDEAWGAVDVLIAAAVVWPDWPRHGAGASEPTPLDVWRQQLGANVEGTAQAVQAVLPRMASRGWGRIVLVSSTVAEDGFPGMEAYGSAKAALHGLSRNLCRGFGAAGILVNVVLPGLIATEHNRRFMPAEVFQQVASLTPTGRLATEDEVARCVAFLASPANGSISGTTVRVSGGL